MAGLRCSVLFALLLPALAATGCGPTLPPGGLRCESNRECASGRCDDGRCTAPGEDDAGQPIEDGGPPDGGSRDGGPPRDDAGADDAGTRDSGPVDGGRDGGRPVDGGPGDDGGPRDDGGFDAGTDASVPDDGGSDAGADAGACGCAPLIARAPIEVCGDGWDNDCDGEIDEQPCGSMRTLAVAAANGSDLPAGYAVALSLTGVLLDDGNADEEEPDGDDVRVWRSDGSGFTELHRVLDPDEDWSAPTTLWFPLTAPLSAGAPSAGAYRLTWGALPDGVNTRARADENEVFHFADYFDGESLVGATGWNIEENVGNGDDWNIRDGALILDGVDNDRNGFPRATRDFPSLSGRFVVDMAFHWSGRDADGDYAWRFLVGDASMETPSGQDVDEDGVGPNLIWGYGDSEFDLPSQRSLAVDRQQDDDPRVLATDVNDRTRVRLVGDTSGTSFRAFVNGIEHGGLSFLDSVPALSRVRLFPTEMQTERSGNQQFPHRRFEHVIVRAAVSVEPTVSLHVPPACE